MAPPEPATDSAASRSHLQTSGARDLEELRVAMHNAFRVGMPCWPAFFLLDLYVVFVVRPGTSLLRSS